MKKKKVIKRNIFDESVALKRTKVLKNGKLLLPNGKKYNLKKRLHIDSDNVTIGRLSVMVNHEERKSDNKNPPSVSYMLKDGIFADELLDIDNPTFIITLKKNDCIDAFNYSDDSLLGFLLNYTTLGYQYKAVKKQWKSINEEDDNNNLTNIMFIKNVLFILSPTGKHKVLPEPKKINVIILALPKPKNFKYFSKDNKPLSLYSNEYEIDKLKRTRIITDILEAGIKCGCKNIVLNPFAHLFLYKDKSETVYAWKYAFETERSREFLKSITFVVDDKKEFRTCRLNRLDHF